MVAGIGLAAASDADQAGVERVVENPRENVPSDELSLTTPKSPLLEPDEERIERVPARSVELGRFSDERTAFRINGLHVA